VTVNGSAQVPQTSGNNIASQQRQQAIKTFCSDLNKAVFWGAVVTGVIGTGSVVAAGTVVGAPLAAPLGVIAGITGIATAGLAYIQAEACGGGLF